MICLLLATGCAPKHRPVSGVVLIPSQDTDQPSVYAEKGGTLIFETEEGAPADTTLEIQFLQNNIPVPVCREGETLTGKSPLTCHISDSTGNYDVAIKQIDPVGGRKHPPRQIKAYIRPCKTC